MTKETMIPLPLDRHNHIALWKITSSQTVTSGTNTQHIFLTHGTYSNRKVCMGIVDFLTKQGYTCWILEWRNHGASSVTKTRFNFEIIAKEDVLLAFDYLINQQKITQLDCITHSGGGLCLTMFLIQHPSYCANINTMTFFGCQATGAASTWKNYAQVWMAKLVTLILGYSPGKKAGRPHNESYFFMKQWFDWSLSKKFRGANNFDYTKKMPLIRNPILSIAGEGDKLIAPKIGCENYLKAFRNEQNRFLCCGQHSGFREDYNHSRLLHSRNASEEIYPIVLKWIQTKGDVDALIAKMP